MDPIFTKRIYSEQMRKFSKIFIFFVRNPYKHTHKNFTDFVTCASTTMAMRPATKLEALS